MSEEEKKSILEQHYIAKHKNSIKIAESQLEDIVKKALNEQSFPGTSTPENMGYRSFSTPQNPKKDIKPKEDINPKKLKLGDGGKLNPKLIPDVKILQQKLIDLGLLKTETGKPTGFFGKLTDLALKTYYSEKPNPDEKPIYFEKYEGKCIAVSQEECDKIKSSREVPIGRGGEKRCSAYMVKCLNQYDRDLYGGDAWDVFNNVKNKGTVKYNAYTSGEINWDKIWSSLVTKKVSPSICSNYTEKDDADKKYGGPVPSIVTDSIPQTSKVNISSLELGDIVGLYHKGSANKGMAFCNRILKKGLDSKGNVQTKEPFTFNSHVGFVGAIKDGIPIIIHNVHGTHMATPANKMLSKDSEDMILWVVSDNDVLSAIKNSKENDGLVTKRDKKWYEFF
jgi:hypothetical protein